MELVNISLVSIFIKLIEKKRVTRIRESEVKSVSREVIRGF